MASKSGPHRNAMLHAFEDCLMMVSRRSELRVHVLYGVLLSTVLVHASVSLGLLAAWWLCV